MWNIQRMPQAREATADADDAHETGHDLPRLLEKTAELKSLIQALRPEYEYTGPRTVGGVPASTAYAIMVPFTTPAEVSIVMVTATDANSVTATLSTDPNLDILASGSASMTASLDGNQSFLVIASPQTLASSPASITGPANWFPVQGGSELFVRVGGSGSKAAYFVLQFRRRINPSGVPNQGY